MAQEKATLSLEEALMVFEHFKIQEPRVYSAFVNLNGGRGTFSTYKDEGYVMMITSRFYFDNESASASIERITEISTGHKPINSYKLEVTISRVQDANAYIGPYKFEYIHENDLETTTTCPERKMMLAYNELAERYTSNKE